MRGLLIFVFCLTLVLPIIVSAQAGGLVPCSGTDCTTEDVIQLVQNIIGFLVAFISILAVIVLVVAGLRLVVSGGNETEWTKAKSMFTNVVIGLILVLAAWLIVDTILSMLTGKGLDERPLDSAISDTAGDDTSTDETQSDNTSDNLVSYAGYQFDSGIINNVKYLDNNFALTVSGGYRSAERNAEVNGSPTSHHLSGRAADFVGSQSAMEAGADWARNNGAIEVLIHDAGSGNHLHVAW
jgi:ABC-type nickel/cobalt efflux system permease component RcnA